MKKQATMSAYVVQNGFYDKLLAFVQKNLPELRPVS